MTQFLVCLLFLLSLKKHFIIDENFFADLFEISKSLVTYKMSLAYNTNDGKDFVTIVYTQDSVIVEPAPSFRKYIQEIDSTASYSGKHVNKEKSTLQCKSCDYKTYHKHALDRHVQAVHDKLKFYQCSRCDYKTSHSSALKRHESKVHERNSQVMYVCEACDYQTIHKSALKRHIANRHQKDTQTVHECSICDYRTTYEFALQRHCSTVHLKEGLYECSLCEYSTVHKHALDRHVRMVHEKPAHLACEHCDFKTAHKSALRMHYATAHEFKDTYKCDKCGYETLYKTALNRHQTTVMCSHEEKATSGTLDSHNNIVTTQVITSVSEFEFNSSDHRDDVCSSKDSPSVVFASCSTGPEAKLDTGQVLPVSNFVPITMIERNGVLQPVNTIQVSGLAGTRADAMEFHNFGELVQVVREEAST